MGQTKAQRRMRKLESQLSATCYRLKYHAKAAPSKVKLLRRCRALGQAMIEAFNEL